VPPIDSTRAHPRYALEVDAQVRLKDQVLPARTKDVSRGGLCFTGETPIPAGSDVEVSLALVFDEHTFSEPLVLRARVVWCTTLDETRHQVGTAFVNLTSEQRAYLDLFLRYLKEGAERALGS
jgi:PilZ domain-containing protein